MEISLRTLMTAKRNLGVLSEKVGDKWFWKLPNQECKDALDDIRNVKPSKLCYIFCGIKAMAYNTKKFKES
ncbi:hypothetical protein [Anaerotignum sp.]|uniref:hypothetical protein n=1 Tax=Anaerotignum sp. TaxID=2039241 RepID=UPI002714B16F|nr:hypothetical protein [Anaerotignum sp.]